MPVTEVLSKIVVPDKTNLTDRFVDAIGFYIFTSLIDTEVEIDVYLQIYLPLNRIRNIPLCQIIEQETKQNITDTETILSIPEEYQDTGLQMALLFLPSESFQLDVFVITKNFTLSSLNDKLIAIERKINEIPDFLIPAELNTGSPTTIANAEKIATVTMTFGDRRSTTQLNRREVTETFTAEQLKQGGNGWGYLKQGDWDRINKSIRFNDGSRYNYYVYTRSPNTELILQVNDFHAGRTNTYGSYRDVKVTYNNEVA